MGAKVSTRKAKREALKDITASLRKDEINYTRRELEVKNMLKATKYQEVSLNVVEHITKVVLPHVNH